MTQDQVITDDYALYQSDAMYVLPQLKDVSTDLIIYSPPFAGLYNYSSMENDFSNCETREQFLEHYEYLIKETERVLQPGRIAAVHCTDILNQDESLWDFPHEIIRLHEKHGFKYQSRITVWKEPLKVRMRTMVRSLMHKKIVEDAAMTSTANPDYVLIFRKKGEQETPVTHEEGLKHYAGEYPLLHNHLDQFGINQDAIWPAYDDDSKQHTFGQGIKNYINDSFKALKKRFEGHKDPQSNKLSHIIWQRYASSVWDDIRIDNVLPYKQTKDEDDEKHVHPLQLDVIDRLVQLYSNPGEVVLTPFMGVGSEIYSPVSMGRKAIGIELKESYFKQAVKNCEMAYDRFESDSQLTLF